MDSVFSITNSKRNVIEVDIKIDGVTDVQSVKGTLFIVTSEFKIAVDLDRKDHLLDTWVCTVPELEFIERTSYPFEIHMIVDGYHFVPMNGTINVVGPKEVYGSAPKNISFAPPSAQAINVRAEEIDSSTSSSGSDSDVDSLAAGSSIRKILDKPAEPADTSDVESSEDESIADEVEETNPEPTPVVVEPIEVKPALKLVDKNKLLKSLEKLKGSAKQETSSDPDDISNVEEVGHELSTVSEDKDLGPIIRKVRHVSSEDSVPVISKQEAKLREIMGSKNVDDLPESKPSPFIKKGTVSK